MSRQKNGSDWGARLTLFATVIAALVVALGLNAKTANLQGQVDKLQGRVSTFVTEITDVDKVRHELLRAIHRAQHAGCHCQGSRRPPQPK